MQPVANAGGTAYVYLGGDGYLRFGDGAGDLQILYPAFLEPDTLAAALQTVDPSASPSIQLDGTAAVTLLGHHYVLVPDLALGSIPSAYATDVWWPDGSNRFRYRNARPAGTSQGFGAVAK